MEKSHAFRKILHNIAMRENIRELSEKCLCRRGQLCGRCLRGMDTRTHDDFSIMLDHEEYDDISMAESLASESQRDAEPTTQVFPFLSDILLQTLLALHWRTLVFAQPANLFLSHSSLVVFLSAGHTCVEFYSNFLLSALGNNKLR